MSKHTHKAYVFLVYGYDYDTGEDTWKPELYCFKADESDTRVFVKEHEVAYEMPEGFDPTARQLAAIEAAKAEALRQYQQRVADLNERAAKLQAITYEPEHA